MPDEATSLLAECVEQEKLVRNASLLGLNESVCGYDVVPLTIEKWVALVVMRSPYVPPFKEPTPDETLAMLWILSPEFVPGNSKAAKRARRKFFKQDLPFVAPLPPFFWRTLRARAKHVIKVEHARRCHAVIVNELRDYIAEAFQDAPQGGSGGIESPEYYSDAIAIACSLAREYGGGLQQYLSMPLKIAFQASKANSEYQQLKAGMPVVLSNPSDMQSSSELEEANRVLHASGAKMHPDAVAWFKFNNSQN